MNRTWIPRYRRTVIGWDKHCRGRVINSREWNELQYKRKIQRLRHYFLIIISLKYLDFCCCCCFLVFWFLFVCFFCFRSLCLSQRWTLFEINHFIRTNYQLFYVYLKHCFLWQHLDFSRRFIRDFPRSLLHMTTSVLKISSNILVNDVFLECCEQHSTWDDERDEKVWLSNPMLTSQ